jgi:hypothetical protein
MVSWETGDLRIEARFGRELVYNPWRLPYGCATENTRTCLVHPAGL